MRKLLIVRLPPRGRRGCNNNNLIVLLSCVAVFVLVAHGLIGSTLKSNASAVGNTTGTSISWAKYFASMASVSVEYYGYGGGGSGGVSTSSDHEASQESGTRFCTRDQIRQGHWKTVELPAPPYLPDRETELRCYTRGTRAGHLGQVPFIHAEWVVNDDCIYNSQFNFSRFCQILQNRKMAFIGDSITWQQHHSMAYLLGAREIYKRPHAQATNALLEENCTTTLFTLRDYHCSPEGMNNMIEAFDPEIIIFNRGVHYTSDEDLLSGINATLERLLVWQQDCDNRQRNCVLFWRTTSPGFPDCTRYPVGMEGVPFTNRTQAEELITKHGEGTWYEFRERGDYHWYDMPRQNKLVEEFWEAYLQKHPTFRISFLDFYEMAILRPDNHIDAGDCLHGCLPGPMDAANILLQHELEKLAAQ